MATTPLDATTALSAVPEAAKFFDGFEEQLISLPAGEIFLRSAGSGPPVLLLHGYAQTSAIWHQVALDVSRDFTVICPDLRGYGRSFKPADEPDHAQMSKRAMASDMRELLSFLGHDSAFVLAHDRGARVAHRLALDHPQLVRSLTLLDIAPTREMYRDAGTPFAQSYWHWYFLTQPAPFPEDLIASDPDRFWLWRIGEGSAGLSPFCRQALAEYLESFRDPLTIHTTCEDYRAGATIDIAHDDADNGKKVKAPLQVLWGKSGVIERDFDCLALWRERAERVTGHHLSGGHYLPEECPDDVVKAFREFAAQA